jgi:hypothetical protein
MLVQRHFSKWLGVKAVKATTRKTSVRRREHKEKSALRMGEKQSMNSNPVHIILKAHHAL